MLVAEDHEFRIPCQIVFTTDCDPENLRLSCVEIFQRCHLLFRCTGHALVLSPFFGPLISLSNLGKGHLEVRPSRASRGVIAIKHPEDRCQRIGLICVAFGAVLIVFVNSADVRMPSDFMCLGVTAPAINSIPGHCCAGCVEAAASASRTASWCGG